MAERRAIERDISKLLRDLDILEGRRGLPSEEQQLLDEQIDRTVARLDARITSLRALPQRYQMSTHREARSGPSGALLSPVRQA
jgi:hypothetical protein